MPADDPATLHQRAEKAGLPVVSVRHKDGEYEVVLGEGATEAQQSQADAMARAFRDEPEPAPPRATTAGRSSSSLCYTPRSSGWPTSGRRAAPRSGTPLRSGWTTGAEGARAEPTGGSS